MKTTDRIHASTAAIALAWTVLLALPVAASAGTPINKRTPLDATGSVEISNTSGSVTVTGWDRNEVEVTGELGDGTERLDFGTTGKVARIKVVLPNKSYNVGDSTLVVKVPAGASVSVNTVSADIKVNAVRGSQRLQSVSADIKTEAAAEDVECKTVSGDVTVAGSGQKGLLTITTVSGDATATRVAGEINANTVSGNLNLSAGDTSRSRLRSTSGDLSVNSRITADSKLDIETISGDVRLDLQGPANGEFDVSSFNGEIRNCFGPKPVHTSEYAPGKELRFTEGSGNARVRIKTLNGDITVCRK